jgi:hypothetical protein
VNGRGRQPASILQSEIEVFLCRTLCYNGYLELSHGVQTRPPAGGGALPDTQEESSSPQRGAGHAVASSVIIIVEEASMRIAWKVLAALAVLSLCFAAPIFASVPKVVFCDDFGYPT